MWSGNFIQPIKKTNFVRKKAIPFITQGGRLQESLMQAFMVLIMNFTQGWNDFGYFICSKQITVETNDFESLKALSLAAESLKTWLPQHVIKQKKPIVFFLLIIHFLLMFKTFVIQYITFFSIIFSKNTLISKSC